MKKLLFIIGFLASQAGATEVRKAAIEFGAYQGKNADPYLLLDKEGERLQHASDMILNIDLACTTYNEVCMFWDNTIESKASEKQYKAVAWRFRLGFSIKNNLEFGYKHLSVHELDGKANEDLRFPIENLIFLQMKFIDRPRTGGY